MHVIIITGSLSHDGTTANVVGFATYLGAQGHEVEVISLRNAAADQPHPAPPFRSARLRGPANSTMAWAQYLHHLSRLRCPNCILVTSDSPAAMLAATLYQRTTYIQRNHPRLVFLASSLGRPARIGLQTTTTELLGPAASRRITAMLVRSAAAIVVTGQDIAHELQRRHGAYACADKLYLVRHWWDNGLLSPAVAKADLPLARKLNLTDAFVVVHHGLFGGDHDTAALAQAVELTSTDRNTIWLFCGNGPQVEQLRRRRGDQKLSNVRHVTPDLKCTLNELLQIGDAHIISQGAQLTGTVSSPRLTHIMAATKPLIVVAPADADCAVLASENKAGFVVPPGRGEVLARCVWQLRDSPMQRQVLARAGRLAFERQFSTCIAYPRLMRILQG